MCNTHTMPTNTNFFMDKWFFSEPTHNFIDHPSNQEVSPQVKQHGVSKVHTLHLELINALANSCYVTILRGQKCFLMACVLTCQTPHATSSIPFLYRYVNCLY